MIYPGGRQNGRYLVSKPLREVWRIASFNAGALLPIIVLAVSVRGYLHREANAICLLRSVRLGSSPIPR